jgi:hypothetical protein
MDFESAHFSAWATVLGQILTDGGDVSDEACPTCGQKTLHLVYSGSLEDRLGYATLWCTTSRDGIFSGSMRVPPDRECSRSATLSGPAWSPASR